MRLWCGRTGSQRRNHSDVPFRVERRAAEPDCRRHLCGHDGLAGYRRGQRRHPRFFHRQPHRMDRGRTRRGEPGRPGLPSAAIGTRPRHFRQGAPLRRLRGVEKVGCAADVARGRPEQSYTAALGEGGIAQGQPTGADRADHVHAQGKMLADRSSGLPALSGDADLFPPELRKRS